MDAPDRRLLQWALDIIDSNLRDISVTLSPDAERRLTEIVTRGIVRERGREGAFRDATKTLASQMVSLTPSTLHREGRFASLREMDFDDIDYVMAGVCPLWPFC